MSILFILLFLGIAFLAMALNSKASYALTLKQGQVSWLDPTDTQRVIDIEDKIFDLVRDKQIMCAFTNKNKKDKADSVKVHQLEQRELPDYIYVNDVGGETSAETDIDVDDGAGGSVATWLTPNMVLMCERTKEMMLVGSPAVTAGKVKVTRAFGTVGAQDLVNNDVLVIVTTAYKEGDTSGTSIYRPVEANYNYTFINRMPVEMTRSMLQSKWYGVGDYRTYMRELAAKKFAIRKERAFLFGQKYWDTNGNRRMMQGIIPSITTNVWNANGTIKFTDFDTYFVAPLFEYSDDYKLFMVGNGFITAMQYWALGKLQWSLKDDKFGIPMIELETPHGMLYAVRHRLFTGSVYSGYGVAVTMSDVKEKYLQTAIFKKDIQTNDTDGVKDEFLEDCTLVSGLEEKHAYLYGCTGGAAES